MNAENNTAINEIDRNKDYLLQWTWTSSF